MVVGLNGRGRGPRIEMSHMRLSTAGDFLRGFPRKAEERGAGSGREREEGCNQERCPAGLGLGGTEWLTTVGAERTVINCPTEKNECQ